VSVLRTAELQQVAQSPRCCELLASLATALECTVNTLDLSLQNLTTLTRLTSLCLNGGSDRIQIANNIGQLQLISQLQKLKLEYFDGLPASIASLTNLQKLDLLDGADDEYDLSNPT